MKAYFEKFNYSNATTEDLWTVLQATSDCDVTEFMPLWTKQTGYPVVSVRLIRAPDGKCSVGLKQQRFLADASSTNGKRLFLGICFRSRLTYSTILFFSPACTVTKGDATMVEVLGEGFKVPLLVIDHIPPTYAALTFKATCLKSPNGSAKGVCQGFGSSKNRWKEFV